MEGTIMEKLSNVPVFKIGKVRDVYDLGEQLLIVASDRISAFDVVLGSEIPDKGKILT
jgi:phosphoribosylaminoimidazole-succinocarboxamide synthase